MLELIEDADAEGVSPALFVICTGGGGLLAGSALSIATRAPGAAIWAAEPEGWDDYGRSLRAGERLANDGQGSGLCDALLSKQPGELTFAVNAPRVAGGVVVTEAEVFAAMRFAFTHLKLVVEPGGAVALAAVLAGKLETRGRVTALILSGGNVDAGVFSRALAA
jgi:threonine dehydratase